jgi:hypothetical protein
MVLCAADADGRTSGVALAAAIDGSCSALDWCAAASSGRRRVNLAARLADIQSVSIIGNEQYQWLTNIMSCHVARIRAEERPRPGDRTQTPGPLHRDFDPPLMGGPAPATTSPGRNEAPTVTPPVVRDRASASVAEDSAGKLVAGPAPIERRVEPRRRRDAHEVSPLPDRAGGDSGRVL